MCALVAFTDDDGAKDYRGTYTAFNGVEVRQGPVAPATSKRSRCVASAASFTWAKAWPCFRADRRPLHDVGTAGQREHLAAVIG